MSRYVQQQAFEDPFTLEIIDRAEPQAGPGEVRVRVSAAGLNPVDWKIAALPAAAEAFGVSLPAGFGNDYAGVIDQVGGGVEGFAVGDRVFGGARGRAAAEHIVATPGRETLIRTPEGLDDETAATLVIAGRTADAALAVTGLAAGETVLIGGAAGGVGVVAVQLAVALGARVIATASEGNHEFLRELGAEPVAYGEGLAERVRALAPTLDAAFDMHGTEAAEAAVALGVDPSRIATIAARNPPAGARATGGQDARPGALEALAVHVAEGRIRIPIAARFPLERIDEAVALQRTGHVRGKVVVTL